MPPAPAISTWCLSGPPTGGSPTPAPESPRWLSQEALAGRWIRARRKFDQIRSDVRLQEPPPPRSDTQATFRLRTRPRCCHANPCVIAVLRWAGPPVLVFGAFVCASAIRRCGRRAADANQGGQGDFEPMLERGRPAESGRRLDVNRMREHILAELSAGARRACEPEAGGGPARSNSDWKFVRLRLPRRPARPCGRGQFPARLAASALPALDPSPTINITRGGRAKLMQARFNDLSRSAGRAGPLQGREAVSCAVLPAHAWANLAPMWAHALDHRSWRAVRWCFGEASADGRVLRPIATR